MALSLVDKRPKDNQIKGNTEMRIIQITGDSSYPTNGWALTPANLRLSTIDFISVPAAGGIVFEYDYTNQKLKAYRQKDPGNAGGADIALPEVGNGVSLSTIVTRAFVIGRA